MARSSCLHAILLLVPSVVLIAMGGGCSGTQGARAHPHEEVRSDLQRATPSDADIANVRLLARSNASFGFDLLRQLAAEESGNLFLSPFSVSVSFAMLFGGARGDTADGIASVLHFDLPDGDLHAAFNAATLSLEHCDDDACLVLANALWMQQGESFVPEYLDLLALYYDSGIHVLDFQTDPEGARRVINDWVASRTEDHIRDIIPPDLLGPLTRLVLTNAIYFRACWAKQFEKGQTRDGAFTLRDGTEITVPRMNQTGSFRYVRDGALQALELPYHGTSLSMVVLLPDPGELDAVLASLDGNGLQSTLTGLATATVAVTLPSFEIDSEYLLANTLLAMGLSDVFGGADFSGIIQGQNLSIQHVLHKAWIKTDEEGTEAAAATVVIGDVDGGAPGDSGVPEIIPFVVNRPFLFVIINKLTQTLLFLGKVEEPVISG